ncbi:histidine kinase [Flavobacterium rivuli WB 3.3-2 = DSM 21788]|uniref:histidine kinase n=1 Tax=Flavobacterium rivuli WB 3.3-2 = DSM 21788 TaxID=1121895 RepID=A0A0A2MAD4_9FLAO|nr:hybrid sensor histidine kinase/response regulator transcription factor [Flavobacterium rivuli]KGO88606.1 histidine kinase [Flavobacterium rivuli WB 3.3-2 = DSM 21788]
MKNVCLYLFLLLFLTFAKGQDYSFKHLQVEDGLSHNSVICMLQDSKGFMWFGTKDGLNRYDGYNFKIFQHIPGDNNSIGSNFIRCLYEFNDYLWVGTDTGLFKYDEKTESFSLIEVSRNLPILDVESNVNGSLWFIAAGSLYKLDGNKPDARPEKYDQFYANYLTHNNKGDVFVASGNEFLKYVPDNNSFQKINLNFGDKKQVIITAIASDGNDGVLIGTKSHGAFVYKLSSMSLQPIFTGNENPLFVRNFLKKGKDELWIGCESGIFVYNNKEHTYQNFRKNYGNPYSLSDNAIYSLVLDKEGGVWIGTYFGGVNYYPKPFTPIKRYFPRVGENSISGNAVREVKKDNFGNLWIGTEDAGLNKLNLQTGRFTSYGPGTGNGNLSHYNIHGLLARGNELWIGTFEHGLDIMDIKTGKIIRHYDAGQVKGLRSDFVFYIYETKAHDIYVLTSSGIHKYLPETDSFKVLDGFPEMYHYTYLIEDHAGTLWAGTYWDGLYYYNPKTKKKGFYRYERDKPSSISCNEINGIFEDSRHRLWVTTENGLNLLNRTTNTFKSYMKADGFPSNVTYGMLEDSKKKLWISSSNGLVKFDPETKNIKIFSKSNGLLSDQFNYCSAFQDSDGEMYFGSVKGLISFNPGEFTQNTYSPPLYITDIFINNEDVPVGKDGSPLEKSILFSDDITLNNHQSTFKLEFASLSFTSAEMTEYWYKIEGLNDNWVALGKNHEVNFTELPAGKYVFKVKALNSYGVWSKENRVVTITVLPPFYFSKIAYMVYFIILLIMGYYSLRYYHRYNRGKNNLRIRQLENDKEREIYQAKIEFFTNIAHEIRTPLTLIKSPLEKLLKQKYKTPDIPKNLGIMEKNTNRLLNLVNELLDFRKAEMKNLKLSFIQVNVSDVLHETYESFSQLIQDKELKFEIIEEAKDVVAFVDEEAFRKVLSNLFSNAVKYGKKNIKVIIQCDDINFWIVVKNDGDIIPLHLQKKIFEPFFRLPADAQTTGTGIGLSLAHSLIELHNGTLRIDAAETAMNSFVLQLPVHQSEEFVAIKASHIAPTKINENVTVKFDKQAPVILVAEDNEELADFIFSELSETYNVILTKNGDEAWKMINKHEVQLVVSDVMMPVKKGIELCREIKKTEKTSHIPVILLTAKSALNARIEGLESGADAYITKPFSMDYLLVQISNLIQNRRIILGHYSSSPLAHLKSLATSGTEKTFLTKLDKVIEDNLKDYELSVDKIADLMNMSRSTLYRSIKEISQLSPNELINLSRLKKAAHLIKTTNMKIYEVAEMVGYKSQTSFGRNFQKHFGMTPTEFEKSSLIEEAEKAE